MADPLEALKRASSIGPTALSTAEQAYRQKQRMDPHEAIPVTASEPPGFKPLGPWHGRAIEPIVESLKQVFALRKLADKVPLGAEVLSQGRTLDRIEKNPLASMAIRSMEREGPEQYTDALAGYLRNEGPRSYNLGNEIIEGLFEAYFGK